MDLSLQLVWAGSACAVVGVMALRLAWGLPRRSVAANMAGWLLMLLGSVLAATGHGAWGLAVSTLALMAAAALCLLYAAAISPRGSAHATNRRVHLLPEEGEPLGLGRRLATLALTVPLAMAVSLILAVAARGLAARAGWHEADANVLGFLLMPLLWAVIAVWLLMARARRRQGLILLIPALAGGAALLAAIAT
ncbi:MAG: hypothetical protein R3E09_13290 [Novosphingobium sp.]|nr:hypothetical protein [Novosphingobium sp.]